MNILLGVVFLINILIPVFLFRSVYNYKLQNIAFSIITFVFSSFYLYDLAKVNKISNDIVREFTMIILIGTIVLNIFMIITFKFLKKKKYKFGIEKFLVVFKNKNLEKFLVLTIILGYLLLGFAFYKMGFIPILEDDPNAKYMTGSFRDSYISVAQYFRLALIIIPQSTFLYNIVSYINRKKITICSILVTMISFLLLMLTNRRGVAGIILVQYAFMLIMIIKNKKIKISLLFFINLFYVFGILFNPIRLVIMGDYSFSPLGLIFDSVPDISDNLMIFNKLKMNEFFSYGRTIFGGLIPYKYPWNPANYSLILLTGSSDVASGGIRFIESIYAYSFGGMILFFPVLIIKGIINGVMLFINSFIENNSIEEKLIYSSIYLYGALIISNILYLDLDILVNVILFYGVLIMPLILKNFIKK